jgi:hypothetical protein
MDTLIAPPPSRLTAVVGSLTAVAVLVTPLVLFIWAAAR